MCTVYGTHSVAEDIVWVVGVDVGEMCGDNGMVHHCVGHHQRLYLIRLNVFGYYSEPWM